jgi:uncharacterized damage-inducible protein DinB
VRTECDHSLRLFPLVSAQNLLASTKAWYDAVRGFILKALDKIPEAKYTWKPSDDVRTFAQQFMHIADSQYFLCGTAKENKQSNPGIEKSALKTKAELLKALNEGFAYCDSTYAGLTDASSAAIVQFFGQNRTKLSMLAANTAHSFEHYGNLVTYMRMNGIVPPSSEAPPAPPAKKK